MVNPNLSTIEMVYGISAPVIVRKITRKSHWGDGDVTSERIRFAAEQIFPEEGDYSIYIAGSDRDLHRIAIGLNSGRTSIDEQIDTVGFTHQDFQALGIQLVGNAGTTTCNGANRLHFEFNASDEMLLELCKNAMSENRKASRLSRSKMRVIAAHLLNTNCVAIPGAGPRCICEAE